MQEGERGLLGVVRACSLAWHVMVAEWGGVLVWGAAGTGHIHGQCRMGTMHHAHSMGAAW